MVQEDFRHMPVMLGDVLEALNIRPGGVYVDCTLGGGGHAAAILERLEGTGLLIGLDRDPKALDAAGRRLAPYAGRVRLVRANFNELARIVREQVLAGVDGVLFDLGVSSPQVDEPERGFSYRGDAPLDMRMDPSLPRTAADLVNELPEAELARIIRDYGEERWAERIARRIAAERGKGRIETTGRLAAVVKEAIPAAARRTGPHPARRTFQALRIAVNDELSALSAALVQAVQVVNPGGRIVVLSYHSLEDRIVKECFRDFARTCICPPDLPVCMCHRNPVLKIVTGRPLVPSAGEVAQNPRARSAKLRVAEKLPAVLTGKEGE
ncbi:MAG: 16S rRNA (cytosine(1402)-N(4))-methyltransferase RsmH [Thermoanaerobacterales bacterium]|nr:16S rRNA (cytosine(1402)-N(4))-methyltransferase RsmH [Thermoanaerobacterales bacterium]